MKIPNPWPNHPHIRFNVNNGDCLGSCGGGPEIEVPDSAVEVLIEPVNRGRYNAKTLGSGRIWSKEFGLLDVEDHLKKVEIKKEDEAFKVRQDADRLRKQEEAKLIVSQKGKEAKPKEEAKEESEPKPKEKIDVTRAASGLAKVTKALKLNK